MIIYIDEKREIINISSTNDIYTKELLTIMVIRSGHPRLPGRFHGKIIYATPGSGKTFVANKYRDVVDGDDLIVQAIGEIDPNYDYEAYRGSYDDPRKVIMHYFRYIHGNESKKKILYKRSERLMFEAISIGDTVLFGTKRLMHLADEIFIQQNENITRGSFNQVSEMEKESACRATTHYIDGFFEPVMQKLGAYNSEVKHHGISNVNTIYISH